MLEGWNRPLPPGGLGKSQPREGMKSLCFPDQPLDSHALSKNPVGGRIGGCWALALHLWLLIPAHRASSHNHWKLSWISPAPQNGLSTVDLLLGWEQPLVFLIQEGLICTSLHTQQSDRLNDMVLQVLWVLDVTEWWYFVTVSMLTEWISSVFKMYHFIILYLMSLLRSLVPTGLLFLWRFLFLFSLDILRIFFHLSLIFLNFAIMC